MSTIEQKQVEDFLKKKNLSEPLRREILDHFLSEIEARVANGISFQEAFLQTKVKWNREFQMMKASPFSLRKVPRIEARSLSGRFAIIRRFAILVAMFSFLLQIIYEPIQYVLVLGIIISTLLGLFYLLVTKKLSYFGFLKLNFHPLMIGAIIFAFLLYVGAGFVQELVNLPQFAIKEMVQTSGYVYFFIIQVQLVFLHTKKINVLLS